MTELEGQLLAAARQAWEDHARECGQEPYLILLNPGNYKLLGWDEILGLPVLPDGRVSPLSCRLVCGQEGRAGSWHGKPVYWIDQQAFLEEPDPTAIEETEAA